MSDNSIITLPSNSTYGLLNGSNEDYNIRELQYSWKAYKLKKNKKIKSTVSNPRTTGSLSYKDSPDDHIFDFILIEYLSCTSHINCQVKIKLKHYATPSHDFMCKITFVNEKIHETEITEKKKEQITYDPKIKEYIRKQVIDYPQYSPHLLLLQVESMFGNDATPPLKVIQNWKRNFINNMKKNRNDIQMIEDFYSRHENFVKLYRNNDDFVVIFRGNNYSFKLFKETVQKRGSVVGLDAQYKQNTEYYPLYIMCCQNSNYNTVPGFIFMASSNTVSLISIALSEIKAYLLRFGIEFRSTLMIDKCKIEKEVADENNIPTILCEFHVIKLIKSVWRKYITNIEAQNELLLNFKEIARSTSILFRNIQISAFNILCISYNLIEFNDYMKENWFSPEWIETWTDLYRPGNREGLYNTNNASESFFRTLLHTHCLGRRHAPHIVIKVILNQFLCRIDQEVQTSKTKTNPSVINCDKDQKKASKLFNDKCVTKLSNYKYFVYDKNQMYTVTNCNYCDCFKFIWHGKTCAHIRAVLLHRKKETKKSKRKPGRRKSTKIIEYKSYVKKQLDLQRMSSSESENSSESEADEMDLDQEFNSNLNCNNSEHFEPNDNWDEYDDLYSLLWNNQESNSISNFNSENCEAQNDEHDDFDDMDWDNQEFNTISNFNSENSEEINNVANTVSDTESESLCDTDIWEDLNFSPVQQSNIPQSDEPEEPDEPDEPEEPLQHPNNLSLSEIEAVLKKHKISTKKDLRVLYEGLYFVKKSK